MLLHWFMKLYKIKKSNIDKNGKGLYATKDKLINEDILESRIIIIYILKTCVSFKNFF